ncbi:ABC transporter substrate-binding protein [Caldivirga maquilingensis]|uniref:Periplasmic binding protein n=1 Tax=Caldivirga maquilingensis (strain ATCC 700844 / DSM 13496 / JCM 10307 / IC-167) TaxID=397948 RepID=A8MCT7_CALMQ|nr:ABC transporter substrate-binding protein [Caldivirga maquilingensis]ABW01593.1 periplasmic binding protein [Caldivirga maquilingensis IC-167]
MIDGELMGVPRRVISLNPSVTEFLFLLGAGDRVVGVDVWSYRPREAMRVMRIGSFTSANIDLIKNLNPDLIILSYPVQRQLVNQLRALAPVLAIPTPVNLNTALGFFEMIGGLLDMDEEALRLVGIYRDLMRREANVDGVLAVFSLGDYVVPCEASYVASALNRVGLNYVKGFKCVMVLTNKDGLINLINQLNPNLIIYEGKTKTYRPQELDFAANRRVLFVPNDTLAHFGPSLPLDLRLVSEAVNNGRSFVEGTSSVNRPSLSDEWYKPYVT